jgi:hypothetical protein
MTDDDAPRFDPRFDPAFQRGFRGAGTQQSATAATAGAAATAATAATAGAAATAATAATAGAAATAAAGASAPAAAVVPGAPAARYAPGAATSDAGAAFAAADIARADFQLDDEDAVPPGFLRRRPSALLVVLLAIAAGLLAASVWLYAMLRDAFAEPAALSSPGDYYVMQSLQFLAPLLATLGLATAIGVIFVYAARPRP